MGWLDDLFSSEKETNTQSFQQTDPWAAQSPFLKQGFQSAQDALRRSQQSAYANAPTDFVAQFSPQMQALYQQMQGFGGVNAGNINFGLGNNFAQTGANTATNAMGGLYGFNPTATGEAIRSEAAAYANSPHADGMINAALRDPYRQLTENDLPSNLRNASARGTNMSNKVQQRAAILDRGFQDRAADVSSTVRGNLYSQGIDTALRNLTGNDAQRMSALSAAMQGGLGAFGAGVNANTQGVNQATGLFNIAQLGNQGDLAGRQAGLDNAMQGWNFGTNMQPWAGLNNYWGVVGSQNWGGTQFGTQNKTETMTPSTMAQIGQLAGTVSSFIPKPIPM